MISFWIKALIRGDRRPARSMPSPMPTLFGQARQPQRGPPALRMLRLAIGGHAGVARDREGGIDAQHRDRLAPRSLDLSNLREARREPDARHDVVRQGIDRVVVPLYRVIVSLEQPERVRAHRQMPGRMKRTGG